MKPGGSDVSLESGGLSGFLRLNKSAVGTIPQLRQPHLEQPSRFIFHVDNQHVVFVFTLHL